MKNKLMILIGILSITLYILMLWSDSPKLQKSSDIDFISIDRPESFTFIEGLGLSFLTAGLGYNFGVDDVVVEEGFKQLMQVDLEDKNNMTNIDEALSSEKILPAEEIDFNQIYEKKIEKTTDSKTGEIIDEKDITITYTTPINFNSETIANTSNAWILNYRFYNDSLTGLKTSYWYSELFKEELVLNRAWNSLRWFLQDYLNCEIVSVKNNSIEAIFYGDDVYWYLYLDKLTNYDILNNDTLVNSIAMKVNPIKESEAVNIFSKLGLIQDTTIKE